MSIPPLSAQALMVANITPSLFRFPIYNKNNVRICKSEVKLVFHCSFGECFWLPNALFFFSPQATGLNKKERKKRKRNKTVEQGAYHLGGAQVGHEPPQSLEPPLTVVSEIRMSIAHS